MKTSFSFMFFILFCFPIFAQLDSSLIVWYTFSGHAKDSTDNHFHGLVHGATLTSDRFGKPNCAYHFDGVNDYVQVDDHPLLRLGGTDFTISAWVKMDAFTNVGNTVLSKRTGIGNLGYFFQIIGDAHPFGIPPGTLDFIASSGKDPRIDSWNPVAMDEWANVVICYDWVNQHGKLYLNTVLENEGILNVPNLNVTSPLFFGWDGGFTGSFYFKGDMDDIRIYDRKLCLEEIDDLYSEGISPTNNPENSVRISLLPNPATHELQLEVIGAQADRVEIIDQLGRTVKSLPFQNTIDVADLAAGMYYLRLAGNDGQTIAAENFVKRTH